MSWTIWLARFVIYCVQTFMVVIFQEYRSWEPMPAYSIVLLVIFNLSYLLITSVPPGYVPTGSKAQLIQAVRQRKADAERRAAEACSQTNDAEGLMAGHDGNSSSSTAFDEESGGGGGAQNSSVSAPAIEEDAETGRVTIAGLRMCHDCQILTPLRAKHDGMSGRCVYKHDHFCGFLGQAVGEKNHPFFLLFVIISSVTFQHFFFTVSHSPGVLLVIIRHES